MNSLLDSEATKDEIDLLAGQSDENFKKFLSMMFRVTVFEEPAQFKKFKKGDALNIKHIRSCKMFGNQLQGIANMSNITISNTN